MYNVRIIFKTPEHYRFNSDDHRISFNIHDQAFSISSYEESGKISESSLLILDCYDFEDYDFAQDVSVILNHALMLAALDLGIGISYNDHCMAHLFNEPLHDFFNDKYGPAGICAKRSFGISVYNQEVKFSEMWKGYEQECSIDELKETLGKHFAKSLVKDEKTMSALLLANTILFEESFSARILLSMTVIEMLTDEEKRNSEEQKIIDNMIELIKKSSLEEKSQNSLIGSVMNLKNKSIGVKCRNLIKQHLGDERCKQFNKLYKMRSEYVHKGVQFNDAYNSSIEAFSLTRDLLLKIIDPNKSFQWTA